MDILVNLSAIIGFGVILYVVYDSIRHAKDEPKDQKTK